MAASHAHISRACLRAIPLRGARSPASLSPCPSHPTIATTVGLSHDPSSCRRTFSTTPHTHKSVASVGKKVAQQPKAPPKPRYIPPEEPEEAVVNPESVIKDITKTMHPRDAKEIANIEYALRDRDEEQARLQTQTPQLSVLDDVRAMADKLEHAAETQSLDYTFDRLTTDDKPDTRSFWFDEDDPETVTEPQDEKTDTIDMPETAHLKLQEMREMRHWTRVAAWEMPLLAKFARDYVPPAEGQVLRFRYTTYMGDFHAAESKVVVEFSPDDMPLTDQQKLKLKKLAGTRYNPDKDMIHMSCESYENQAQNKRSLSDQVDKMIEAAKDPTDTFEDVPLDLRHHKAPKKPQFPKEWYMTNERRAELAEIRERVKMLDGSRVETGKLADGIGKARRDLNMSMEVDRNITAFLAGKVYKRLAIPRRKM